MVFLFKVVLMKGIFSLQKEHPKGVLDCAKPARKNSYLICSRQRNTSIHIYVHPLFLKEL